MARVARPVGPRGPRSVLGALLVLTLLASVSGPARRVTAASPEPGAPLPQRWSAAIRAGDCQHLGNLITPLTDLTVPHGRLIGHGARTLPAASSFTRVPLPFDALLAIDDAIVVQAATPTRPVIACGAIGGVIDRNGALTIGVRGFPPSGYAGIADLSSTADLSGTDVAVFLAPTQPAASARGVVGWAPRVARFLPRVAVIRGAGSDGTEDGLEGSRMRQGFAGAWLALMRTRRMLAL
jgi:hypothetical protein